MCLLPQSTVAADHGGGFQLHEGVLKGVVRGCANHPCQVLHPWRTATVKQYCLPGDLQKLELLSRDWRRWVPGKKPDGTWSMMWLIKN